MQVKTILAAIVLCVVFYCAGVVTHVMLADKKNGKSTEHISHNQEQDATVWTCSMHPQIQQSSPGQCPICGMDLIPLKTNTDSSQRGKPVLELSDYAMKLADVQTASVKKKYVSTQVRMVGKVAFAETNIAYITSRIAGRIDRLYVDYTGIPVKKGDHLVSIYSPDLYAAQQELIQSLSADTRTLDAVREKLRLWGLQDSQIAEIENRKSPSDHITIYAPINGIVIHKEVVEGMYVDTGTKIYTIADLNVVWVKMDAYENDVQLVRYGQPVEFTTEAYPGKTFQGTISFIDPVLDTATRTVKVRVNVENSDGLLKPGMFVNAVVNVTVGKDGIVIDEALAGKWISPMHPEIVKNQPGECDVCGMPLVRAETLGYGNSQSIEPPLVIPASAPLITGKRAVIYKADPDKKGTFSGVEIQLGMRAGDYYIVLSGLREGDRVVTNGNFKIDSAIQIQAKPSMMNPMDQYMQSGDGSKQSVQSSSFDIPDAFRESLLPLFKAYFALHHALSRDSMEGALTSSQDILNALDSVDYSGLSPDPHSRWEKETGELRAIVSKSISSATIIEMREYFHQASEIVIQCARLFGVPQSFKLYLFHCPMAFNDTGAAWIQDTPDVENPYFGSAMFSCGMQTEVIDHK
ncbi:MAG: efflux RND transporter periplasmic adaptor subunit [Candidatus Auribacter fodinae]|jgi:Cu(I)/Ag(I) efflux system membrane fusion protein|uniref:Efflux RND transporter periplasmic adaptor subunit n=1 Tax=Candidatus Auribacter fodinae TaxID=2093366 RepID=A0A3A4QW94_9BACT|nr:MAG: efflux RND transporter periplasmic adaptor subunit [Candidatus Auribacter fodinae]